LLFARGQSTKVRYWQIALDWLAILSGLVALLHFFFPKHGARAGDYILNRFAERSKTETVQRIQRLQASLSKVESLPLLTDFEDKVLTGFSVVVRLIVGVPTMSVLFFVLFRSLHKEPLDSFTSMFVVFVVVILFVLGDRWRGYFD
jgi:hypothetical protein